MHIVITKKGGYAGLTEEVVNLDTSQLNPADAQTVERTVQSVDFGTRSNDISVGADLEKYEITISDGNRRTSLVFADDGTPGTATLSALVKKLASISKH